MTPRGNISASKRRIDYEKKLKEDGVRPKLYQPPTSQSTVSLSLKEQLWDSDTKSKQYWPSLPKE